MPPATHHADEQAALREPLLPAAANGIAGAAAPTRNAAPDGGATLAARDADATPGAAPSAAGREGAGAGATVPAAAEEDVGGFGVAPALSCLAQMTPMYLPLLVNLVCTYGINITSLAFTGHLGKTQLAAAALATSLVGILGRVVLYGMVGGLDTLASQAFGAGNLDALGAHFRTAVLFLLLHALPLGALLAAAPLVLREADTEDDLGAMAGRYVLFLLPSLLFECLNRPLNSVLVAQRISRPQMGIQMLVLPLHIATNYALVFVAGLGYVGAAIAYCAAAAYVLLLTAGYVVLAGLAGRCWGGGGKGAQQSTWQALRAFARLSYPSCFMRCAESWGFSLMTVAAGKLPDPGTSVAAVSIAFNIYGVLYMAFSAFAIVTGTRVGNALGAGSARTARFFALTALCTAPLLWTCIATLLLEPHTQHWLTLIFTNGSDAALTAHLRRMLALVAALELFDGSQVIMTGVIQGAGKQKLGVLVNIVAFWLCAIPAALALAFWAGWDVEGMYSGMLLGPAIQAGAYVTIIAKLNWRDEAKKIAARAAGRGTHAPGAAA